MGKIIRECETKYEVGDVIVFRKDSTLLVGIIEGYYVDWNCDQSFWFNVRINNKKVYTYSNGGDIAEWDIIGVIEGEMKEDILKKIKDDNYLN